MYNFFDYLPSRTLNRLYNIIRQVNPNISGDGLHYQNRQSPIPTYTQINAHQTQQFEDLIIIHSGRKMYRDSDGDLANEFYIATKDGRFQRVHPL